MSKHTLGPKKEVQSSEAILLDIINLHPRVVRLEAMECPATATAVRVRLADKLREYRDALAQEREAA